MVNYANILSEYVKRDKIKLERYFNLYQKLENIVGYFKIVINISHYRGRGSLLCIFTFGLNKDKKSALHLAPTKKALSGS